MSHNLKPNTQYVIVPIQVAVTLEDYESGAYADGLGSIMNTGMFDNNDGSKSGVVGDWTFRSGRAHVVTTDENPHEGCVFE